MKKLLVVLLLGLCLTGCATTETKQVGKATVGATKEVKNEIKDAAEEFKDKSEEVTDEKLQEPATDQTPEDVDDAMGVMPGEEFNWSYDAMDETVKEFYFKLKSYRQQFGNADKVCVTDITLPQESADVNIWEALQDMMLVKYSKEWDIGDATDEAKLQCADPDELAVAFGFESSDYASSIFDAVAEMYTSGGTVEVVDTYAYAPQYSTVLEVYDYANGEDVTTYKVPASYDMEAVLSFNDQQQTMCEIPLVGQLLMHSKDSQNYYIFVPNTYTSFYTDGHFDTHSDVELWADWEKLIQSVEGVTHISELADCLLVEDHGITIVPEVTLASMSEEEFKELVDYLGQYVETEYSLELIKSPDEELLAEYEMPYDLYYDYLGVYDVSEGANVQRLAGNNTYWETHEIGGKKIEPR